MKSARHPGPPVWREKAAPARPSAQCNGWRDIATRGSRVDHGWNNRKKRFSSRPIDLGEHDFDAAGTRAVKRGTKTSR